MKHWAIHIAFLSLVVSVPTMGICAVTREEPHQYDGGVIGYEQRPTYLVGEFPSRTALMPPLKFRLNSPLQIRTTAPAGRTPTAPPLSGTISTIPELIASRMSASHSFPAIKTKSTCPTIPATRDACDIPPLHFGLNSAFVAPNSLSRLVSLLRRCQAERVSVHGFTCDLGSQEYNDRLARHRASATAKALESEGFEPVQIEGKGKQGYLTTDPAKRHLNRRVEIQISKENVQ